MRPRRLPAWGLRNTVLVSFAAGALLLSLVLALGTYLAARHYLIEQRQQTAVRQAFVDAAYVRDGLKTAGLSVSEVLGTVSPPADSTVLVHRGGRWFSSSLQAGAEVVPAGLQDAVAGGAVSVMWTRTSDGPAIAVGVPLEGGEAEFFEVAATTELRDTLATLGAVLLAAAVITAIGGALLGRAAARRLVAPLDDVAAAAARIAVGQLNTRLAETDDPDLATIVGAFNTMVERLDERLQRDARFAADIAHELRSPLTTLMTSVDLLGRQRDHLPQRSQQALDLIAVELERFRRSLEDLLELGRLDAGVAVQSLAEVDLRELVQQVVEVGHRSGSLVHVRPANGGNFTVRVDKLQFSRALTNLLDNADLHAGGVVAVRVEATDGFATVAVEDDGPGIAAGDRERIFERYFRAGSRASRRGTGLGLSLVAETVQAHGGSVWYADRTEGGGRFVIRLPLSRQLVRG
jgi:two-component system, OmpR family, sensor histidine kinase MtrB